MRFKEGDRVRIKENTHYNITVPGSKGSIRKINGDICYIDFDNLNAHHFPILIDRIEPIFQTQSQRLNRR